MGALAASKAGVFVGEDFAVYESATPGVDTIIGADLNGLRVYTRVSGPAVPPALAWTVLDDSGGKVTEGEDGAATIYASGGTVVGRASAEARDATGKDIPVDLRVTQEQTLTIALRQPLGNLTYPILFSLGLDQTTTAPSGGWNLHAFDHQLEGSLFELRVGTVRANTCRFLDVEVKADPGSAQERRAVAIDWDACRSIEEVGVPSAAEVTASSMQGSRSATAIRNFRARRLDERGPEPGPSQGAQPDYRLARPQIRDGIIATRPSMKIR